MLHYAVTVPRAKAQAAPAQDFDASDVEESAADHLIMPPTAYLVLGVLSVLDQTLTAGEIKSRAELSVGAFYWSPSVSHVRRELLRMLKVGYVAEKKLDVGERSMTVYEITDLGEQVVREWTRSIPDADMIVKHALILKTWLYKDEDPKKLLESIDEYLERQQQAIDRAQWVRDRAREVGIADHRRELDYSWIVNEYSLRFLYAERSNIQQMRDEIAWRFGDQRKTDVGLRPGSMRRREHDDQQI